MASTTDTDRASAPGPSTSGRGPAVPGGAGVHTVTTAPRSIADDRAQRNRNYLLSMTVRTVCFLLACFVPGPLRWVFAAGAVFLPYVAVVFANAVNVHPAGEVTPAHGGAIGSAPAPRALADDGPVPGEPVDVAARRDVHVGEVIASQHHGSTRHDAGHEARHEARPHASEAGPGRDAAPPP